jgi:hypothetical protein
VFEFYSPLFVSCSLPLDMLGGLAEANIRVESPEGQVLFLPLDMLGGLTMPTQGSLDPRGVSRDCLFGVSTSLLGRVVAKPATRKPPR